MDLYTLVFNQACFDVNQSVLKKFESLGNDDFKEKTHLFNGRYENLYLDANKIPGLEVIINAATENAAEILKVEKNELVYGFWFNQMLPGDVTTAHTHDDDDERLSCVYYINVPENSGGLILTHEHEKTIIQPRAGAFVFFSPATLHEVSRNESNDIRLSIAFNFGLK